MPLRNRQSLTSIMLAGAVLLACATQAPGAVRLVPQNYPTIQAAVNAAVNGDTVLVGDGTFTGAGNRDIELLGKAITVRSLNGADHTTIDVQAGQSQYHNAFYLHQAESSATVIQGFTITGGHMFNGGGMLLIGSSPTIRQCMFTGNQSDCWGAGLYFDGGASPLIDECAFDSNVSSDDGGAIFGLSGSPVISNCRITNNNGTLTGGAITIFGSGSPRLINSTVVGNHAMFGSAIYSNNLQVTNSIIWGNTGAQSQIYTAGGQPINVKHTIVQGGYPGVGNLNVAPSFVDAPNGDFHLVSGSAGIDAGDPNMLVPVGTLDMDGDPRLFGTAIDMGIDEFRKHGDATGDHLVNIADLLAVIGGWGPCTWSNADLNGDFSINMTDLLLVVSNWGA